MIFESIGGGSRLRFTEAIFTVRGPGGSLYVPVLQDALPESTIRRAGGCFADLAARLAHEILGDPTDLLREHHFREICESAFDFEVPVRAVSGAAGIHLLELFHGPTLAFKDFGARFLARAMEVVDTVGPPQTAGSRQGPRTVLVATSGDTGGAAAAAFHGLEDYRVVVLYPAGRISQVQESQLATLGDNIVAVRVDGTFDDCQRIATEAFGDPELARGWRLTSANSVNVGRLMPQVFYYFWAAVQLWAKGRTARPGAPLLFSVPSGNLGNLTAGLYARWLGLDGARFVAATNRNDTFPSYLRTGRYEPRSSIRTPSSAMDVGDPSNFVRIVDLFESTGRDMESDVIPGGPHSDEATVACMREVYERHGVLLDPHSAVAWLGLRAARREGWTGDAIVVATAHPAKFPQVVERAIGCAPDPPSHLAERLETPPLRVDAGPTVEGMVRAVERAESR